MPVTRWRRRVTHPVTTVMEGRAGNREGEAGLAQPGGHLHPRLARGERFTPEFLSRCVPSTDTWECQLRHREGQVCRQRRGRSRPPDAFPGDAMQRVGPRVPAPASGATGAAGVTNTRAAAGQLWAGSQGVRQRDYRRHRCPLTPVPSL